MEEEDEDEKSESESVVKETEDVVLTETYAEDGGDETI